MTMGSRLKLLAALPLVGLCLLCKTVDPPPIDALMTLQEQKSLAEGEAREFKKAVSKDKKEYREGSDLYERAKAKVDAFLSGARSAILADTTLSKTEYDKAKDDAVAASRSFMDYSRKTRTDVKGLPLADIGQLIINIAKAAWEAKTKYDDALRQRILADLETYRWEHFEKG